MAEPSNIYVGVAATSANPITRASSAVFQRAANNRRLEARAGNAEAYTVFVHPANPEIVFAGTNDGVWRSTDRGATSSRRPCPTPRSRSGASWSTAADPKKMPPAGRQSTCTAATTMGVSWRKLPTPRCRSIARPVRLVCHALRAASDSAERGLRGSRDQRRDASTTAARLDRLQCGLVKLAELPASEEQDRGATRRPKACSTATPSRSIRSIRHRDRALRMGPVQHQRPGQTWQDMDVRRFSPTTYGRDVKASASEPDTCTPRWSVGGLRHDGGLYAQPGRRQELEALRQGAGARHHHVDRPASERPQPSPTSAARYDGEVFAPGWRQELAGHAAARRGPAHLLGGLRLVFAGTTRHSWRSPAVSRQQEERHGVARFQQETLTSEMTTIRYFGWSALSIETPTARCSSTRSSGPIARRVVPSRDFSHAQVHLRDAWPRGAFPRRAGHRPCYRRHGGRISAVCTFLKWRRGLPAEPQGDRSQDLRHARPARLQALLRSAGSIATSTCRGRAEPCPVPRQRDPSSPGRGGSATPAPFYAPYTGFHVELPGRLTLMNYNEGFNTKMTDAEIVDLGRRPAPTCCWPHAAHFTAMWYAA